MKKKIAIVAGVLSFLFHAGITVATALLTVVVIAVFVIDFKQRNKNDRGDRKTGDRKTTNSATYWLLPFSSGLICFIMKLYYWDEVDYLHRVNNLLLIASLFSVALLIHRYGLIKKGLRFFNRLSLKKRLVVIFVVTEILFILASWVIVEKGVTMGGDEPHYLVISHSIARDFDLNVFNQYARDEYKDFMDTPLDHHARVGKGFKKWYSYGHLPGLSVTLAPFFLVDIPHPFLYFLIRAYLGLFGALLAVLVYRFSLRLWKHLSLSLFITVAFMFTVPVFFFSIHVFAELQAALLILASLYLVLFPGNSVNRSVLIAGLLLSLVVFWGLKFALFIFLFAAGFFVYFFFITKERKKAFLFVLFPVLFQILFFYYLYFAYGNINPMSIYNGVMTEAQQKAYYGKVQDIPLQKRVETLLGIFIDQRDGLLLYSPLYFFFFPGLILAFRKFKKYYPHLLVSAAGFGYIVFMGYSTVRAGYCPQARYLAPVVWVLMLFAIIYRNETKNRVFKRFFYYVPVFSVLVVAYQVMYPFTLYQSATHINLNRPGLMFQQWGNLYFDPSSLLPSFVKVEGNFTYLPNIVFFILFLLFMVYALLPVRGLANGVGKRFRNKLAIVSVALFVLLIEVFALFPTIPTYNPVLLTRDDGSVCKIYGKSVFPTRSRDYRFDLKGSGEHSFTVSTLSPAAGFKLAFENSPKEGELDSVKTEGVKTEGNDGIGRKPNISAGGDTIEVDVFNFDRLLETVTIQPEGETDVYLAEPVFRKHRNQCFYRFHIRFHGGNEPELPARELYLRIYPAKER